MGKKHYDQICNVCGKEIHPPRGWQAGLTEDNILDNPSPDCVYIQRFYASPHPQHGKTNYVCLDCDKIIDEMLRKAGAR